MEKDKVRVERKLKRIKTKAKGTVYRLGTRTKNERGHTGGRRREVGHLKFWFSFLVNAGLGAEVVLCAWLFGLLLDRKQEETMCLCMCVDRWINGSVGLLQNPEVRNIAPQQRSE